MIYQDYYKKQLEDAQMFQDFVVDVSWQMMGLVVVPYSSRLYQQTVGESKTRCEIKHDKGYARTGNLYIEIAEKAAPREGPCAPSGIYRNDNSWLWIIGNYDRIFYIQKTVLKLLHNSGNYKEVPNSTQTSEGFLLPDASMRKFCGAIIEPRCSRVIRQAAANIQVAAAELFAAATRDPAQMDLMAALASLEPDEVLV